MRKIVVVDDLDPYFIDILNFPKRMTENDLLEAYNEANEERVRPEIRKLATADAGRVLLGHLLPQLFQGRYNAGGAALVKMITCKPTTVKKGGQLTALRMTSWQASRTDLTPTITSIRIKKERRMRSLDMNNCFGDRGDKPVPWIIYSDVDLELAPDYQDWFAALDRQFKR